MLIDINVTRKTGTEFADTLTKEQRQYAHELMARQLADLLKRSPDENLYWVESKTDLMEIIHEVYMTDLLVDGDGRPSTFRVIVKRACAVLHVPMPSNPYSIVYNARSRRKGVKQTSVFSRYCWHLYTKRSSNPLNRMVRKV